MDALYVDLIKLLMAIVVGGLIGVERELRDKDAGFRTLIFICSGATLFTIFSLGLAPAGDPTRVAANIVSGVGFLGAGVILRERGQVRGLTTASTIWTVAALGMGIGSGQLLFVAVVTSILMVVLLVFPLIERFIGKFAEARTYEIVSRMDGYTPVDLQQLWKQYNLHVRRFKQGKRQGDFHTVWEVSGMPKNHDKAVERLYSDEKILEFSF